MNKKIALVDFDETLIKVDSLAYILKKEKGFFDIPLIFCGFFIIISKPFGDKAYIKARSYFKKRLLKLIKRLSQEKKNKYIVYFRNCINQNVFDHIKNNGYDEVTIVSAGEQHIISATVDGMLHINHIISNDWDHVDGFVTCWGTEKVRRVKEIYKDSNHYHFTLLTDSFHDGPLMEMCNKTYLISKDGSIKLFNDRII
ncbi:MAG: HAD family hydrolase [Bacillota bacterium]|nr:HAD family hydrolase [Bacillota bacterium]